MTGNIHAIPLLSRLIRHARWPSLRTTVWLTMGLGLLSLIITIYLLVATPSLLSAAATTMALSSGADFAQRALSWGDIGIPRPIILIYWVTWFLYQWVAPLIGLSVAAILTVRYRRSNVSATPYLTPLSSTTTVQGLIFETHYRMRILLAVMAILTPVLVVYPYMQLYKLARYGGY
ncbi:MAG: hypothetical protein IT324_02015, partial [Anaerolineae bacterium]|nr:hypothetical protein [Anaerolineae bacterium]